MTFLARVVVTEADGEETVYWFANHAHHVVQRAVDQWESAAALNPIKVEAQQWEPNEFGYCLTLEILKDAPLQIVADVLKEL